MILLLVSAGRAGDGLIIEAAGGVGSPVSPFSSKWKGAVRSGGLYFKEFAVRGKYVLTPVISVGASLGWLKDYSVSPIWPFPPPELWGPQKSIREVFYFIPSIKVSLYELRLDVGAIVYREEIDGAWYVSDKYPFNGSHRLKPSIGVELGEPGVYIFGRFSNSFPLISGGGIIELGIGGKVKEIYEHKGYVGISSYHDIGLGYRGEIRIYKETAFSVGAAVGRTDAKNIYTLTFGIKTSIGK